MKTFSIFNRIRKDQTPDRQLLRQKELSILLGVIFGLFGLLTGAYASYLANSVTIFSEILKNPGLTAAVIISFICVKKVNAGRAEGYDYGHGKL